MLALERSLLRGFLGAAESLEWKQGEVASAGEGGPGPAGGRRPAVVRGRSVGSRHHQCLRRPQAEPGSRLVPPFSRARSGGGRVLPPFLPLAGRRRALAGAAGQGRPLGSSAWRRASGTAGRVGLRREVRPTGLSLEFLGRCLPVPQGFRWRGRG